MVKKQTHLVPHIHRHKPNGVNMPAVLLGLAIILAAGYFLSVADDDSGISSGQKPAWLSVRNHYYDIRIGGLGWGM